MTVLEYHRFINRKKGSRQWSLVAGIVTKNKSQCFKFPDRSTPQHPWTISTKNLIKASRIWIINLQEILRIWGKKTHMKWQKGEQPKKPKKWETAG